MICGQYYSILLMEGDPFGKRMVSILGECSIGHIPYGQAYHLCGEFLNSIHLTKEDLQLDDPAMVIGKH
jgi:hypothetical protein